jgi:ATP-dependent DNA helicase RecQ
MQWPVLRPFQKEALSHLEKSGHLICVSPTGSGKSRIYEVYARDRAQKTILVTPLIALARQQAEKLRAFGLKVFLSAGNPEAKKNAAQSLLRSEVWIASPEQLSRSFYKGLFREWRPDFFVVDECHCLWDWGTDFRPSFLDLPELARSVPRSHWLTATLPLDARDDLRKRLPKPLVEMGKFSLPENLYLEIRNTAWADRAEFLIDWISKRGGLPGIIFVSARQSTERVARLLRGYGKKATSYHAGLSSEERRIIEKKVADREIEILVSTSAFGMGMDHRHLNWVLLWQPPVSILQLTQALGRVGRDEKTSSRALIFWSAEDFRDPSLNSPMKTFLSREECRSQGLSKYYNDASQVTLLDASQPCFQCDFCLKS